jgi:hypothetical protein
MPLKSGEVFDNLPNKRIDGSERRRRFLNSGSGRRNRYRRRLLIRHTHKYKQDAANYCYE